MFLIKYSKIWELYKVGIRAFWTTEEIDLGNDIDQIRNGKLSIKQQRILLNVLSFFAEADLLVMENILHNFLNIFSKYTCVSSFLAWQAFNESQHAETYNILLETLLFKKDDREKAIAAINQLPSLVAKNRWLKDSLIESIDIQLLKWLICEGIWFQSAFAIIFWFRTKNLLPGLCQSNELIARDEGLHAEMVSILLNERHKLQEDIIHQHIIQGVNLEILYIHEVYVDTDVCGLVKQHLIQYVKFVGDYWSVKLTAKKIYNVKNPLGFMNMIALQGKTNFFEKKVTEYTRAKSGANYETSFDNELDF